MSDLKIQAAVEMSSEGAERALDRVGDKAGQMATRLGREADKASKSVDGLGAGADKSASEFTRAEGKIVASIKRTTTQLEQLGKTASQKLEIRISEQGLDAKKFEPMLAKLRELEAAQVGAVSSGRSLSSVYSDMAMSIGGVVTAAAGFSAIKGLVSVQREFDVLNASLVTMTGSADEAKIAFGALQKFAATTPFSLKETTEAFVKLKSLGLDPSERAMQSYGNTASAMGKSLTQFIEAVADASTSEFERLKEFGIKAKQDGDKVSLTFQGVTTTIKNSSDQITEYLTKIGQNEFAGAMAERAKTLDGAISNLSDSWDGLFLTISEKSTGSLIYDGVKLASAGIEDLTKVINAMSGAADENAQRISAMASIQNGLGIVFETTAALGANVSYVLKAVGIELGGLAAQAVALAGLDFRAAKIIGQDMKADAEANRRAVDALTESILNARNQAAPAAKSLDDLKKSMSGSGSSAQLSAAEMKKAAEAAEKLKQSLIDLRNETIVSNVKAASKELDLLAKSQDEYAKSLISAIDPLEKQARTLEREVATYGLTEAAIQNSIVARLEEARAIAESNGAYPEHLNYLDQEIELRRRIASASSQKEFLEANKKAAEKSSKEWEKVSDDINRSLTDALMRGFESGKSFGQNFADSLKASLKTLVIRLVVNATTNTAGGLVATAADALLGTKFSASSAAGMSGGTSGLLSGANNLSTAYNAGSYATAASAAYAQYQAGIPVSQWALGTYAPVTTATSTSGAAANSMAGSSGTGAAGTVAWVAAIVMGMYMSSQAWKAGIRWTDYSDNARKEPWYGLSPATSERDINDILPKLIFGKDFVDSEFYAIATGSALAAQLQMAFDGALFGKSRVTGSQITGSFTEAEQGFTGMQGVNYKKSGGLFSKSKEWTEWRALSGEVDSAMDSIYRGVRNSFIMLGDVFEDSTLAAKLKGFVYSFTVGELSVDAVTNGLSSAMSNVLTPSINAATKGAESWAQTFQRVLLETNAVSRTFEVMGKSLVTTFGKNNLDGILSASDAFVQLFGDIEKFNTAFDGYFSNFFTAQERTARGWQDMIKAFEQIGVTMPTSRAAFRALVDSLDLSTASGRATFKQLMDLQGAFASLTPTLEDAIVAAQAMTKAAQEMQAAQIGAYYAAQRKAQEDAIKLQITQAATAASTAQDMIDSFKAISKSLGDYRDVLRMSAGSGVSNYDIARQAYQSTAAQAMLGNVGAAQSLQGVAETFLQASRDVGTATSYARDLAGVIATVDGVVGVADRQVPIAQQQLAAATAQTTLLQGILDQLTGNTSPTLVKDYKQAATDFAAFFGSTAIGQTLAIAGGTMQRISDSMGLFIDSAGKGTTFSQNDTPYSLAASSAAYRQYLLQKYGTWTGPSFAAGGYHAGGMRLVGERGPELEFTGPSRILNANDTAALLGGGGLSAAVSQLTREVAELRSEQRAGNSAIAANTAKSARLLDKFDAEGMPEVRAA